MVCKKTRNTVGNTSIQPYTLYTIDNKICFDVENDPVNKIFKKYKLSLAT